MESDPKQDIPTYIWQSPPIISSNFVGGETVLGKLHDLLESNPVVVVLGMHGVGKTELALQYVKKYGKKYEGGYHSLDLRDRQLVDELARYQKDRSAKGIELQTEQPDPSKHSNWCWKKLERLEHGDRVRVLVVLDNVDKAAQIQGMLPFNPRFRLLVMMESLKGQSGLVKAQNGQSGLVKAHHCEVELHPFTDKAALALLKKCVGSHRVDVEPEAAGKLCNDLLGNLPLGIELAGGYLHQDQTITIAEFFTDLSKIQEQLDGDDDRPSPPMITQERGVKSVLELSWLRLDSKSKEVCKLLGLFAPRAIPWELVTKILSLEEQEHNNQGGNKTICDKVGKVIDKVVKRFDKIRKKPEKTSNLKQIPKQLANLRLIKWDDKNNTVILDTLVRSFFAEKAQAPQSLHEKFVDRMYRACKDNDLDDKNPVRFAVMVPHIEEVATKYTSMLSDLQFDPLFIKVGRFYDRQWMYVAAFQWYGRWLEKADLRLGHPCDPDTRLKNLAHMYDEIGKFSEAQPEYKRALQICEQLLKKYFPKKKDLAPRLYDLGEILFKESDYKKPNYSAALSLYERAVQIVEDKNWAADAQSEADEVKAKAQSEANEVKAKAQLKADELQIDAKSKGDKLKTDSQLEANKLKTDSQLEADKLKADAQFKGDKLKIDAQSKDDKLKADAQLKADELQIDAKSKGNKLKADAQSKGDKLKADAQLKADELKADAESRARKLKADAQLKGDRLEADAQLEADELQIDAESKARRLKANAESKAKECREYLCCLNSSSQ